MFSKLNKLNFYIFIILLPYCALGYFYSIFSSWAANASLYPLLSGLLMLTITCLYKKQLFMDQSLKYFAIFNFVILIETFIMAIVLSNFIYLTHGTSTDVLIGAIRKMFTVSIIFLTVYYTSFFSKNYEYFSVLKVLYLSFIFVLIYGYIQLLAILIPFSFWFDIYMMIQRYVNFGWIGLNENFNQIPQIYKYGGRVILTTQEPSIAGYLITSLYYPFFLSSLITNYSVYKVKFLGKPLELVFFVLSLPLVFFTFSTSLYVVFLCLILITFYLYYKNNKITIRKIIKQIILGKILFLAFVSVYHKIPQEYTEKVTIVFNKLFMKGELKESAQTRYGLNYGGIIQFLHYPIFGVGLNNSKYIFEKYIPNWAINAEVADYLATGKALGPRSFWITLLCETGIVGVLSFLLFLYSILKKYLSLKIRNNKTEKALIFLRYAFFYFIFTFVIQGFQSAALFFIWQWAIFGFLIGFYHNIRKSYCIFGGKKT